MKVSFVSTIVKLTLVIMGLVTLSACVALTASAPAPTVAAGEESAPARITAAIELTTNPWLWLGFTDPVQQSTVETPAQYTITFNSDRTVSVKADCNNSTGSYTADDSGSLTIKLGATTLAACPAASRSDEFVQKLGSVTNFFFEEGFLYLDTMADGGTFQLASAPESAANAMQLTVNSLKNGSYSGIYEDTVVTLTDGHYQGEGDAAQQRVDIIDGSERFGDLNNDGVADAIVLLMENSGGTATNTYVAAQLNRGALPVDGGAVWVGDRIQIKSITIENGQVVLEIVTQGPEDALCCATLQVRKSYGFDGMLVEVGSEELERISAADLNGTSWALTDLGIEGQALVEETEITLSFTDGAISGSGGCNTYKSSFSLDETNPAAIIITPVAATKMSCPQAVIEQENRYFTALAQVSVWGYQAGHLALLYDNNGTTGTLIFALQAVE